MPDNQTEGMLETFLSYLIPKEKSKNIHNLWNYTQQVVQEVKNMVDIEEETNKGERFTNAHEDKAKIYTWLAWQEPPGRQLHDAIKCTLLDPKHENSQRFVNWFKKLYDL